MGAGVFLERERNKTYRYSNPRCNDEAEVAVVQNYTPSNEAAYQVHGGQAGECIISDDVKLW